MAVPAHTPVLLEEIRVVLAPAPGERVLDATVGLGGHAEALLLSTDPDGTLVGLDTDSENLSLAAKQLSRFGKRVTLHHANFRDSVTEPALSRVEGGLCDFDVIVADLGLSSAHVDDPSRGFTFRSDAPLDLRFDRTRGSSAAQWIAETSEAEIARVFFEYGEVRFSRRLASAILEKQPKTTAELVKIVESIFGFRSPSALPQIFQALRIAVNDELTSLEIFLRDAPTLLRPGGRLGIIAYHSLEDRLVKRTFRTLSTPTRDPLTHAVTSDAPFTLLTKRPIVPSQAEIAANPRSRSAKLRAIRLLVPGS